ncbi:hypothetical protein [Burkholderia sp. 22313]|uniref:hypothetical protein n=1 Tax=Burkholderia sp. 22313 TaxID=3453908 RepID=UPI003F86DCBC
MRIARRFALIVTVRQARPGSPTSLPATCPLPYNILYNSIILPPKPVVFVGNALDELRGFPLAARRDAGHQIDQVQRGLVARRYRTLMIERQR